MPFCSNCGQQIQESAKFCAGCGSPTAANNSNTSKRTAFYDGELHKCPNCGEVLNSFVAVCPACGYELRGSSATGAVKEFASKLDKATTEFQKANIIRNFPIPNTKEDIFEFMILASSNIDDHPNKEIFDAWIAKFEQCYDKAKLTFLQDSDFSQIQSMYTRTIKEIRRIKRKGPLKKFLTIAIPILIFIVANIVFWSWIASSYPNEQEEVARLEAIVVEVESALENKEFDLAMMHAKSIDYSAWTANDELERQWDIKRDYLIKKVIAAAAEEGVTMDYPVDTADEKDKKNNDSSTQNNYQQNIDEFNQQMEDVKEQWNEIWNSGSSETNETDSSVGFVEGTFESVSVKGFSFDIPNYWSEEGSKNEYLQYYAEKGDKVVMLSIAYPEESDDDYDVSFDGLYTDNENMIKAVGAMFTDGDVYDHEVFESENGVKGILYRFTYNQKIDWLTKVDGSGYCFCFPSEDDRRWFYVVLLYTNNVASDDYRDDYMTLISTIRKKSQ